QDRPFWYGQKHHVVVFRLLADGSLDELFYTKQVRKQQFQNISAERKMDTRYFECGQMMMKNLCAHVKWKQMNVSLETCLRISLICTFLCLNIFHGLSINGESNINENLQCADQKKNKNVKGRSEEEDGYCSFSI
ncbi:hypothetical protein HID58_079955, partial [Brassica napus]